MDTIEVSFIEGPDGFPLKNEKWCSATQELLQGIKGIKKVVWVTQDLDNFKEVLRKNDNCKHYTLKQVYNASKNVDFLVYGMRPKKPNFVEVAFLKENIKYAYLLDYVYNNQRYNGYTTDCLIGMILEYKKEDIKAFYMVRILTDDHNLKVNIFEKGKERDDFFKKPELEELRKKIVKNFEKVWTKSKKILEELKKKEIPEKWLEQVRPFPEF
jgi:hypothetical protein